MSDLIFYANGTGQTAARTDVKVRNFNLIVDEPEDLGGSDLNANPVEYILAGFAGCVNVVANLTAKELGIKVKNLKINVSGTLNPNKLFGTDNSERAGYKKIQLSISADVNANKELKSKWLKTIEERCPVSDNLKNPTEVVLSLN
jgi:uncharacterized OsmC-like protein|tara:strand:+ start:108 stop:542 length:435 start_codon:yes stop_codon:yes gene_type:complete